MSHETLQNEDDDTPRYSSIVQMSVEHCQDLVLEMSRRLRVFLDEHRHDDPLLAEAHELMTDHDEAFDPQAFERGERGRASVLFLKLSVLLERHPAAGKLIERLLEMEHRARARAIDLLRQSENLGNN